ncbi:MAG TPA: regulatory protein RecX [Bacteroidales bacterium]|nr:regulatory protein RecX [Bacteroidales bacterium]HRZ48312.1 regulatory protein RecX [Bacteroidales bacterium]
MTDQLPHDKALEKARKYCAAQERSEKQVQTRLQEWGVEHKSIPAILGSLRSEGYLSNQRFARLYARSKFNQLGWGKIKIARMMTSLGLPSDLIASAMEELDEAGYHDKIEALLRKKLATLKADIPPMQRKQKLLMFGLSRGFEKSQVFDALRKLDL